MNFAAWQAPGPREAAAELVRRTAGVPRSVIARMPLPAELEQRFAMAPRGLPLSGVPVLVKDMYDVAGEPTFGGTTFLPEARPVAGDGALAKDLRAAGLVLAGKAQMVECAYGLTGENAHYGDCPHPQDGNRTSGGSSSGSAHAVGKGIVPLAFGSDTGGSVRLPAAFCGIYGMRLTPHHRWVEDALLLAPSFDTPGWFTASAEDMRTSLAALVPGSSEVDDNARRARGGQQRKPSGMASPRVGGAGRGGYLRLGRLDADVAEAVDREAMQLAAGIDGPLQRELLAAFADGPRAYYGISAPEAWKVHAPWFARYRDRYGETTRARLERALGVTEEERSSALVARERIKQAFALAFEEFDFLVLPASPFVAQTPAEFSAENRNRILELTTPASVAGLPVLTIPVGLPGGLSTGLQVVVPRADSPVLDALLRG